MRAHSELNAHRTLMEFEHNIFCMHGVFLVHLVAQVKNLITFFLSTAEGENPQSSETSISSSSSESDLMFVAKLTGLSFAGGALIKYGSLLSPIPFSADATLAILLVAGPPLAYGAMLLFNSDHQTPS